MPKVGIENCLQGLIRDYDCVIIPGWGGFVSREGSARVHPITFVFEPPVKDLSFNRNLLKDDGLLANALSEQEAISHAEALSHIQNFVRQLQKSIKTDKYYLIKGVGTFKSDVEGNIQFLALQNALVPLTSYGLPVFNAKSVAVTPVVPTTPNTEKQEAHKPKSSNRKQNLWWLAAAILILMLVSIQYSIQIDKGARFNAGLSFWGTNTPAIEAAAQIYNKVSFKEADIASSRLVLSISETPVIEDNNIEINWSRDPVFYIVGGAFTEEENATGLCLKLQNKGLDVIRLQQGRYTMVVLPVFEMGNEYQIKQEFKKVSGITDAWLMRN